MSVRRSSQHSPHQSSRDHGACNRFEISRIVVDSACCGRGLLRMKEVVFYAAGGGLILLILAVLIRLKLARRKEYSEPLYKTFEPEELCEPQLVHRLCPHHNVVQSFAVEQKDSLDEHLDVLTRKLAEKEGRLRLSKSKIRETQHEIDNLHAIDADVQIRYREIMDSLRTDLLTNEQECRKLQDQIEWVSRRRAELREEVRKGQRMYGEAAAELVNNLAELQRSRSKVVEKPHQRTSDSSLRHRKEPRLPQSSPNSSSVIKSSHKNRYHTEMNRN